MMSTTTTAKSVRYKSHHWPVQASSRLDAMPGIFAQFEKVHHVLSVEQQQRLAGDKGANANSREVVASGDKLRQGRGAPEKIKSRR